MCVGGRGGRSGKTNIQIYNLCMWGRSGKTNMQIYNVCMWGEGQVKVKCRFTMYLLGKVR